MFAKRLQQHGRMTAIGKIAFDNYKTLTIPVYTKEDTKVRIDNLKGINIPGLTREGGRG